MKWQLREWKVLTVYLKKKSRKIKYNKMHQLYIMIMWLETKTNELTSLHGLDQSAQTNDME